MGIINPDLYESSNGIQKNNTYISFNDETLYLRVAGVSDTGVKQYRISANYRIFWDKAARNAGRSFLEIRNVSTVIDCDDLDNTNLYSRLYAKLKADVFPNAIDEI